MENNMNKEFEHDEELYRQCRVIVTKKVNTAPSFFCSGLQPKNIFPLTVSESVLRIDS
jgi:hypothetical protein